MCEGKNGNFFKKKKKKEKIYSHFIQNSSKLQNNIPKAADWYFFLFHMDKFFSVTEIKCSLSAATLPWQILYFSEECFMFSSWHISILMQLLHFYPFQFYRITLLFLMFYPNLKQNKNIPETNKKRTQNSWSIPTYPITSLTHLFSVTYKYTYHAQLYIPAHVRPKQCFNFVYETKK